MSHPPSAVIRSELEKRAKALKEELGIAKADCADRDCEECVFAEGAILTWLEAAFALGSQTGREQLVIIEKSLRSYLASIDDDPDFRIGDSYVAVCDAMGIPWEPPANLREQILKLQESVAYWRGEYETANRMHRESLPKSDPPSHTETTA